MSLEIGLVHVYTGNGKGKTSAALGLCLRALGRGLKCCFIQFIKGIQTGEMISAGRLENFEFIQVGRKGYNFTVTDEDVRKAKEGLKLAERKSKSVDVLVLDELNVAIHLGLLEVEEVINFLRKKPKKLEVIITGRYAKQEIIEMADYVTEMTLIKHPFYRGLPARKGIDL